MATFEVQIEALTGLAITGSSDPTQDELSQFLKDGVLDVSNRVLRLRPQDREDFIRESAEQTANASLDLNGADVISVVREDGVTSNNWRPCKKISLSLQHLVTDIDSLHFSSKFYPSYMVGDNGQVSVFPVPGSDPDAFKVYYVNNVPQDKSGAVLIYSHSDIKYFVDDKVYLVVLYASIQALMAKMTSLNSALPSDITLPTLPVRPSMNTTTISIPSFTAPDAFVQPVVPDGADVDFSSVPTAPTYISPTISLGVTPTISNLTISAVGPVSPGSPSFTTPDISSIFNPASSPPSYTAPVISLGTAPTISDLSISDVPPPAPSVSAQVIADPSSFAPAYTKPTLVLGAAPTISNLSISSVVPIVPSSPGFSTPTIDSITVASTTLSNIGVPPTYTSPTTTITGETWLAEYPLPQVDLATPLLAIVTNVDLANGVFDAPPVSPIAPDTPSFSTPGISSISISNLGTPPTYTTPVVGGDAAELSSLDDLDGDNTIDEHANQPEWDQWFATAAHMIEDEEDTELAQVQLQKISAYIQAYSGAMQNQLNVFNDANAEYQGKLQEAIQQAQINAQEAQQEANLLLQKEQQEYASTLQKYSAEIQDYQAEVGTMSAQAQGYIQTAQGYTNEVQTRLAVTQTKIAEYQIRVQDALNTFNDANAEYQAKLQEGIQQAQINAQKAQSQAQIDATDQQQSASLLLQKENQEYSVSLQRFSAQVQEYQANVAKEVQQYQQNLEGDLRVWQAERQTDLQKYASDIQNELNEFNKENVKYQAILQEYVQEAQLLDANEARKVQKYQAEVQTYQAIINKEVQQYQQNLAGDLQVWQTERTTDLQKHGNDIQSALNNFNKENIEYQAQLQQATQEVTLVLQKENQEYAAKLQKYSAELQNYQADVSKEVQEYQQNLAGDIQVWQAERTTDLQKYGSDIQNETARVTDDMGIFQQEITKSIQKYQAETGYDLGRYTAEVQSSTAKFTNDLQKNTTTFQSDLAKFNTDLKQTQQEDQEKIALYGQKDQADYEWVTQQYGLLKAQYNEAFAMMAPPAPQQQQQPQVAQRRR